MSLKGKRVRVYINEDVRYGTIVDFLTKEETKQCAMFGQLIKARMDDTGLEEEFTYDWELPEEDPPVKE